MTIPLRRCSPESPRRARLPGLAVLLAARFARGCGACVVQVRPARLALSVRQGGSFFTARNRVLVWGYL